MAGVKGKGPIVDPGICRCCGVLKKCRILNVEYEHIGKKEVYSDLLMDCFGLLLSNLDGEELDRLICATCVVRIREAAVFRAQVLKCEEAFLLKVHQTDDSDVKFEVKIENEHKFDGVDLGENDHLAYSSDGDNSDENLMEIKKQMQQSADDKIEEAVQNNIAPEQTQVSDDNYDPEHLRMKQDLMQKMQKLKSMLNKRRLTRAPPPKPRNYKPKPDIKEISHETMVHTNTVHIVQNSFVTPFRNRISNYYCFYCKEIYTNPCELRTHTLTHNPNLFELALEGKRTPKIDLTRIDCRLCDAKIDDIPTLKHHLNTAHDKHIYLDIKDEFLPFRLIDGLRCLECDKPFVFIDKLIDHMTDHYGKCVCEVCGACFIEETSLAQHMRVHKKVDVDYPCDVCGKNLKSNYSRQLHVATVHEKRPVVPCYKCDESFLSYAQRNRHLINVHGDRRKFPCTSCDKVFDVRKTMVEHTRKYHLQVCRHQCDLCEQRFYSPSQLKEHKTSHTGERNFVCELCEKRYPRKQSLLDHLRTHSGDKKYTCDICLSSFTQNGSLKSHIRNQHQFDVDSFVQ